MESNAYGGFTISGSEVIVAQHAARQAETKGQAALEYLKTVEVEVDPNTGTHHLVMDAGGSRAVLAAIKRAEAQDRVPYEVRFTAYDMLVEAQELPATPGFCLRRMLRRMLHGAN